MTTLPRPFGEQLRTWRQRRRLSQLALALEADVSTRHLSYLETGRAQPGREMVLRLAERLHVPLRERNALLLAAGFAPAYTHRPLTDDHMTALREGLDVILRGHEPYPALAVDRHWTLVAANAAVAPLLHGVAPALLRAPANVLRLSLHPQGLAPRIVNLAAWRAHLLDRLTQQLDLTADPVLRALREELLTYPAPAGGAERERVGVATPLRLRSGDRTLSLISATMVFGTPVDVTASELAVESFLPADADTAEALRAALAPPAVVR